MKLLLLEDDAKHQTALKKYFRKLGQRYDMAHTYKEGLQQIIANEYDCVVISLNLAGGKELKLVQYLSKNQLQTGILLTSKNRSLEERLKAFEKGADDFLIHPYDLRELHARIKAIVRRRIYQGGASLIFKELSIDLDARQLFIKEKPIKLTKTEFDILLYLVRNKNRVVTKDAIVDFTWDNNMEHAASFDFIYAHIKNLRKKLAENGCGDYVKTVYGMGYKFVGQ